MSVLKSVTAALSSDWLKPRPVGGQVCIPTTCLYPSGAWISVFVDGGSQEMSVHDDGGAVWEARGAGITLDHPARNLHAIARKYGLEVNDGGAFIAERVSIKQLAPTIVLVANASQEAARHLFDKYKVASVRNVKQQLTKLLEQRFHNRVRHNERILGQSNKKHRFDHVISVSDADKIIVDFASNDANSINAKVVAHYDVREAHYDHLTQRIVYDEEDDWSAANLSLLEVGAQIIPYSSFPTAINKLIA